MKGILIIDMPEHCNECVFRTGDNRGNYWCHALLPRLKLGHIDGVIPRHIKCPLKPITDVIPVEYIKEWVKRDDDFWSPNLLDYFNKLYDDWRIENRSRQ